jgi:hypothetical protein
VPFPERIDPSRPIRERSGITYQYSSVRDPENEVVVLDNPFNDYFRSEDRANQYILFEMNRQILFSGYFLTTYGFKARASHLKQWRLVAELENGVCEVLDEQDSDVLNDRMATYECRFPEGKLCKRLKLEMTGPNHAGNWYLVLHAIRFDFLKL